MQTIFADLRKKLLVPLLPTEETGAQHASSVHGKQCAYAVELAREDFEYH